MKKLLFLLQMITLLSFVLFLTISCEKDSELFSEAIQENIDEQIEKEQPQEDTTGEDTSEEDVVLDDQMSTELKAFPSAYGAGAYTSGGRGGRVLLVTTREDRGEGSLRWALGQQGPRIVVFKVGGEFELTQGRLKLGPLNGDLTVAGQTAPGDGVTITGDYLQMSNVDNVIFRYVRFRGIQNGSYKADIITGTDCTNIIMDHCSGSWGYDEIFSFTSSGTKQGVVTTGNITIQRSIFAEMDPDHSTASLIGSFAGRDFKENSGDFSWNNNFAYNISHRFPNVGGSGNFEVKNNVVYNWAYRLTSLHYGANLDQRNNYYKIGPRTRRHAENQENGDFLGTLNRMGNENEDDQGILLASGNLVMPGVITDPNEDNLKMWRWWFTKNGKSRNETIVPALKRQTGPNVLGAEFPLVSATEAYDDVLSDVGANKSLRSNGTYSTNLDELDEAYINAAITDGGTFTGSLFYRNPSEWSLPPLNNENNDNGYLDSDGDGMPDDWEISNGLNPDVKDDSGDLDQDGYTNIEEFINLVDIPQS